jgi:hypothetical protein
MSDRSDYSAHPVEEIVLGSRIGTDFLVTNIGPIRVEREQVLAYPSV